jgi:hypothetical protein
LGTAEYNSYNSGRHSTHVGRGINCTKCHNTSVLANGHFSNLQTSSFEQDPATTIGGGSTSIGSYSGSTCSSVDCHRSRSWNMGGGGGH